MVEAPGMKVDWRVAYLLRVRRLQRLCVRLHALPKGAAVAALAGAPLPAATANTLRRCDRAGSPGTACRAVGRVGHGAGEGRRIGRRIGLHRRCHRRVEVAGVHHLLHRRLRGGGIPSARRAAVARWRRMVRAVLLPVAWHAAAVAHVPARRLAAIAGGRAPLVPPPAALYRCCIVGAQPSAATTVQRERRVAARQPNGRHLPAHHRTLP